MSKNPTDRIAERRRFIAQRTAELQAELDKLMAEGNELDIAERVFQRFSEAPRVGAEAERASAQRPANGATEPDQAEDMSLPKMVFRILEEAKAEGRKGVEASEIVAIVRQRWKPQFTADNIRPTLWRMAKKEGRLKKRGKLYSLPINSPEGEAEAMGASARH